jgi:hypothetical protein
VLERIGALDFRDDERMMPELFRRAAHCVHIRRALDERLTHGVDSFTEREFETLAVAFGEGADAQVNAGKI